KALVYGNLGTGGMSKAAFEQSYPDFEPGYGTHTVEHRAVDAFGNVGDADEFMATVLPGESPECTTTLSGKQKRVVVQEGVTCLDDANVVGGIRIHPEASLVASNSSIESGLESQGADVVQLFGGRVSGKAKISGTAGDVSIAGTVFNGSLALEDNDVGDYGVVVAGNTIKGFLSCGGNIPEVTDMGAPNSLRGGKSGQCESL
ncbi:MAG: M64 family metallopeptidase, partial [Actinomycetota bacterium]